MEPAAATSPPAELRALCVIGLSHQILPFFHQLMGEVKLAGPKLVGVL